MKKNKPLVDANKLTLLEYKMMEGQVKSPQDFLIDKIEGYKIDNALEFGFNLEAKQTKVDLTISLETDSLGINVEEGTGNFHFVFIFEVENLDELAVPNNDELVVNPSLITTLGSVAYSTSRGILLTRLQGSALQNFILPIINPGQLIK